MAIKLLPFDPAAHIETEEDTLYYLEAAMEGNDAMHITRALNDIIRSKAMERSVGCDVKSNSPPYIAAVKNGDVRLETLTTMLGVLGLELTVQRKAV